MTKKITLLFTSLMCCSLLISGQTMVNDFETGSAPVEALFGATMAVVTNPASGGANTTDNCLQIGRTSANWYELIRINVDPDLTISDTENKYLSFMVYNKTTDLVVRFDANADDNNGTNDGLIRPDVLHSGFDVWEQIVIPIRDTQSSTNFTKGTLYNIILHADAGGSQVPGGFQLDNSTSFLYVDEIQILDSNPLSNTDFQLEKNISLYPNPAQSVFKIETKNKTKIADVSMYSILGTDVTHNVNKINRDEYDISNLSSGMYLIKISDENGSLYTQRLMKK